MKLQNPIAWLLLLVLPLGFASIWRLQHRIDAQRESLSQEGDDVLLRSRKLVKVMSLEYAPLLADIYWTRVVQYYGNKHVRGQANLELLWPLLDITTTLDPNLLVSYRFGAMFLSQKAPTGAGRPDLAVQLIQRGIQADPEYWRSEEHTSELQSLAYLVCRLLLEKKKKKKDKSSCMSYAIDSIL